MKFGMRVQKWDSLPQSKCQKIGNGVYHFSANLYQKLPSSVILVAVSPHFKSDNG